MRTSLHALAATAALVIISSAWPMRDARAEGSGVEVLFTTKPIPATETKEDAVPMIEATIIGAPKLDADKFILFDTNQKPPVELKGVSKRNYNQGSETLAVVIVMSGWELWIGNDTEAGLPQEDPTRRAGVLTNLRAALDTLHFKDAGPAGSLGALITYANTVTTRIQMGPLGNMNGSALGTQKDYLGNSGSELVKGIEEGLSVLHKASAARKVMIVIGDGCDINPGAAKGALGALKKQAYDDRVQVFAIVFRINESCDQPVIASFAQPSTVNTADNISTSVKAILERMDDRQYVLFKGFDREKDVGLNWDGKAHDLAIKIDKDATDANSVTLAPIWDAHPPGPFPWWIIVIVAVGLILIIILAVKIFGGKKVEMPAPMPMPMPAVAAPAEAPKPAAPMKTVMIGVGGDEGGFPVVGWLVPLNGPAAYQTYRLRSGGTKIGTAPPADIVVNDGFMSTDHCMIQCSPQGFTLVDGGSTNGSYVNDKRVQKHELVDNDTVTLGKTNFKFKSIV
jgi:FHA domain-containing protein